MLPSLDVVAVSQAPFPQIIEDIYLFLQIFEELFSKSSEMCFFKSSKPIATSSLQSSRHEANTEQLRSNHEAKREQLTPPANGKNSAQHPLC